MDERVDPPLVQAAKKLLANGGKRFEAGETIVLPLGTTMTVLSGWAAVRGGRVICTGRLSAPTAPCAPAPSGAQPR